MRLIVMGTGPFAVPMFRSLLDSDQHEVLALITRPARPVHGKKRQEPIAPMRQVAEEHGLAIHDPESINAPEAVELLRSFEADLMVVCDYGQILKPDALATTRLGGINLHASLLPKYRGAAPINWAIYHGESVTGVTVIHMTRLLDGGPCLVQTSLPILAADTAVSIEQKLAEVGIGAVDQAIEMLQRGQQSTGVLQDKSQVTQAPRLKKTDGAVDWQRSADQIFNQVRALQPWPKTHTFWQRPGAEPVRLILEQVAPLEIDHQQAPGTVLESPAGQLVIACGHGALEILEVQPAGKRVLSTAEFLRGYSILPGTQLTAQPE